MPLYNPVRCKICEIKIREDRMRSHLERVHDIFVPWAWTPLSPLPWGVVSLRNGKSTAALPLGWKPNQDVESRISSATPAELAVFLTTPCPCAGENERCFRCGGWGYIDVISKGHIPASTLMAVGANSKKLIEQEHSVTADIVKCNQCGTLVRNISKHIAEAHKQKKLPILYSAQITNSDYSGQPTEASDKSKRVVGIQNNLSHSNAPENVRTERSLDASRDYYAAYRENGRFGSHASHDAYDDESDP